MNFIRSITGMLAILIFSGQALAQDKDLRHFMFVGEPNEKAWQMMMDDPIDREEAVGAAFQALGGDIVSYYWGLGNGKNYITVTIPNDNELIQAIYMMRMPSGLLKSYSVTELMPSSQMSGALRRAAELIAGDETIQ